MKRISGYGIIFFLLMLIPWPALSVEKFENKIDLPKVESRTINGEGFKCLDSKQWTTVLLIASEYKGLHEWRIQTLDTLNLYKLQIKGFESTILHYESIMDVQEEDRKYLSNRITDILNEKNDQNLTSQIKEYILYAVVLAEAAAILGLVFQ